MQTERQQIVTLSQLLVARHRENLALSLRPFAKMVGLDSSYCHLLEKGKRRPTRDVVARLTVALDVSAEDAARIATCRRLCPTDLNRGVLTAHIYRSERCRTTSPTAI